ncbi:MAG: T9SS type A sorting domain-containing protein [Saprospiraceae bacterium]
MKITEFYLLVFAFSLSLFSIQLKAQDAQVVTPDNVSFSAQEIVNLYGNLINVTATDIENFYLNILPDSISNSCSYPEVNISDMDINTAYFDWPDVAGKYTISVLRLSNGASQTQVSTTNSIQMDLPNDLYLFAFQSNCTNLEKSAVYGIIVDKPVMIYGQGGCGCRKGEVLLSTSFSTDPENVDTTYEWNPLADVERYVFTIQLDAFEATSFPADVHFVPGTDLPDYVVVNGDKCMVNATINNMESIISIPHPNLVDANLGVITFGGNDELLPAFRIELSDTYVNGGIIRIDRCHDKDIFANQNTDEDLGNTFILQDQIRCFPNPVKKTTTVQYDLSSGTKASLILYNNFGQQVNTLVSSKWIKAGSYQQVVDLSFLPKGIYTCVLKTDGKQLPIKILHL